MKNMVALKQMGYDVQINYSLGEYNRNEFGRVLDFAIANKIHIKAIALIRPNDTPGFYNGSWIDPTYIESTVASRQCVLVGDKAGFGGLTKVYRVRDAPPDGSVVQIKNIAVGRLVTDFCRGCSHQKLCGEGIYALRAGTDGIFKPCLLRTERFTTIDNGRDGVAPGQLSGGAPPPSIGSGSGSGSDPVAISAVNRSGAGTPRMSYEMQILHAIDAMVGDWKNAYYTRGAPQ